METKEIAMQKRTTMMGTACVLAAAALTAGPAAANSLTDFSGVLTVGGQIDKNDAPGSKDDKSWLLGGSVAAPLSTVMGLNFEVDGSFQQERARIFPKKVRDDWNFGGSAFWANDDGRIGINLAYTSYEHLGNLDNGGAFAEWYFGALTVMGKGGFLQSDGSSFGGHGNYLGIGVTGYVMPNLGITGGVNWGDIVTGQGCQTCGRNDLEGTAFSVLAEWLFDEDVGISGYVGYTYQDNSVIRVSNHDNVWRIGVHFYTGGGALIDRQRNGNLNPWLPGVGANLSF
jgi:hypothetical protein